MEQSDLNDAKYIIVEKSPDKCSAAIVLKKLEELISAIKDHKSKGMQYYCQLGTELAIYKRLNFTLCLKHGVGEEDMYKVLDCKNCIKASAASGVNAKIKSVIKKIGYSKSHINFLIAMSKLCKVYPKFKYNSMSLDQIKTHRSYLWARIEEDKNDWM